MIATSLKYDLSIIIVNYNTALLTSQCLESIFKFHTMSRVEIIVVDNASTDGSQNLLKERFPTVTLIQNEKNDGFAVANNLGIQVSQGKHILLLNSDTKLTRDIFSDMSKFMELYPRAGAIGVRLLNEDGTPQTSFGYFHSLTTLLVDIFPYQNLLPKFLQTKRAGLTPAESHEAQTVNYVSGACLLSRRECIDQVGLFDENFFMYSEEMDLCYRMRQFGWDVYLLPWLDIIHLRGASSEGKDDWRSRQMAQSRNRFIRKHHSFLYRLFYYFILIVFLFLCAFFYNGMNLILLGKVHTININAEKYSRMWKNELSSLVSSPLTSNLENKN